MEKTSQYQLNQWAAEDRILREDFNRDNANVEAGLVALGERVTAEEAARQAAVSAEQSAREQAVTSAKSQLDAAKAEKTALAALQAQVDAMPFVKQRKMRPLFAHATRCELDAQGRVLIPQNLRDFAGLTKSVTVVGNNNHAEFWDSDAWNAVHAEETTPENILSVMEELDF